MRGQGAPTLPVFSSAMISGILSVSLRTNGGIIMHRHHRFIVLSLLLALALAAASVAGAAGSFVNMNSDFFPENGLDNWNTRGDVMWVPSPYAPEIDGMALMPFVEATSAIWQTHGVPDPLEPGPYTFNVGFARKDLTAQTAFWGAIIYYENGTISRVYRAVPELAGKDGDTRTGLTTFYVSPDVAKVSYGAMYFGKRGDGVVAFDFLYLCVGNLCPLPST